MALSQKEKIEIAEIVSFVLEGKLSEISKEIVAGFAECIDWHNDNFAKIMQERNGLVISELAKQQREVIEIHTKKKEEKEEREKRQAEITASKSVGFIAKSKKANRS